MTTESSPKPDAKTGPLGLLDTLLKRPEKLAEDLGQPNLKPPLVLAGLLVLNLVLFGLVVGSFSGGTQFWAAPLKIVLGLLVCGVISFPSLYILSCLGGAERSIGHLAGGLIAALSLIGLLLVGFAPIVWIFSQSTDLIGFIGAIVFLTWIISLWFGLGFLKRIFDGQGLENYRVWAILFALVTLQMSTALRPIIGTSETLLPTEKKFFLQHWMASAYDTAEEARATASAGEPNASDIERKTAPAEGQNPHVTR